MAENLLTGERTRPRPNHEYTASLHRRDPMDTGRWNRPWPDHSRDNALGEQWTVDS
ncbi:MAG: hypothetical protein HC888_10455 [Candidatus Competibacteraceae bacterium]|nr:hypothetical protein [Candidatus Competibacteraceae bacterium]